VTRKDEKEKSKRKENSESLETEDGRNNLKSVRKIAELKVKEEIPKWTPPIDEGSSTEESEEQNTKAKVC